MLSFSHQSDLWIQILASSGVAAAVLSTSSLLGSASGRVCLPPAATMPPTSSSSITQTIDTAAYNLTATGRIFASPAGMSLPYSLPWMVGATTPGGDVGGRPSLQVQLTKRARGRTHHLN